MILDKSQELSDAQSIVDTGVSTNYFDAKAAHDYGLGLPLYLVINVVTAVVRAAGACTVTFSLETDDNTSFSSAATPWTSAAIAKATLIAGYNVVTLALPAGMERYSRVKFTFSAAADTAAFDAFIVNEAEMRRLYPSGFTVS